MRLRMYPDSPLNAYLELLAFPKDTNRKIVARSVDLHGLIPGYEGPRITIDFDVAGQPIGIEIVYAGSDEPEGD